MTEYQDKRWRILRSNVHLVEIDLLRRGTRPGHEINTPALDTDYILLVNRAGERRLSDIWPVQLNEPLPTLPIPLRYPDPHIPLDLTAIMQTLYQRYRYDVILNYQTPIPAPTLRPGMADWWADHQPLTANR